MAIKLLSDRTVKGAKARAKPYRLADGGNLYCLIAPTGTKSWQFRYRLNGTPHTYTIGKYPRVSLEAARVESDRARAAVEAGEHLTIKKHASRFAAIAKKSDIFEKVAAAWVESEEGRKRWTTDYKVEVAASLRNHLHRLGPFPISQINAPLVAPILRGIQHNAPLMLEKVHRRLRSIMDYAVEEGLIPSNPLPQRRARVARRHFPAVTDLPGVGEILRAARAADPCKGILRAHMLLAYTGMRVSEVVGARWDEFELNGVSVNYDHKQRFDPAAGNWLIPRERMKRKDVGRGPHVVPLPPVLRDALKQWRTADGDGAVYVCPAPRNAAEHITPEGVEKFYRNALNLGGKHSPHSWRSAFSTICREAGKAGEVIEAQLDHVVGTKVESAYDRAARVELRRELIRWYEEKLIAARDGGLLR